MPGDIEGIRGMQGYLIHQGIRELGGRQLALRQTLKSFRTPICTLIRPYCRPIYSLNVVLVKFLGKFS